MSWSGVPAVVPTAIPTPEVESKQIAVIVTVAGTGSAGDGGDGGPATDASLSLPVGVFVSTDGSIYIADTRNGVIRKVRYRCVADRAVT